MSWREFAACRGADPEIFFVNSTGRGYATKTTTRRALAYCDRCEVTAQCLTYAISTSRNDYGIWGGMTSSQRIRLRQGRLKTPTAPVELVTARRSG